MSELLGDESDETSEDRAELQRNPVKERSRAVAPVGRERVDQGFPRAVCAAVVPGDLGKAKGQQNRKARCHGGYPKTHHVENRQDEHDRWDTETRKQPARDEERNQEG